MTNAEKIAAGLAAVPGIRSKPKGWCVDCATIADALEAAQAEIERLREENREMDQLFERMYAADMRGVAMWREKNPGNELVMPDQGRLVEWMLTQIQQKDEALRAVDESWCDKFSGTDDPKAKARFTDHTIALWKQIRAALPAPATTPCNQREGK